MLQYGDKVTIVKPHPGAHSAVMEGLVGKTVTFKSYGTVPGGTSTRAGIHAFCQEFDEVPLHPDWLRPAVGGTYVYGYDHQKKQPIILDITDRTLYKMNQARERAKAYENVTFLIHRDDDVRKGLQVEALPNPWPKLGPHDHLVTAYIHDEQRDYKPGEVQFIFRKPKLLDLKADPKTRWNIKFPVSGRLPSGAVGNTPKDKPSFKQPELPKAQTDTCNCSGYDLFWRGHTCGREKRGK